MIHGPAPTVAVTGASGYIGRRLLMEFAAPGRGALRALTRRDPEALEGVDVVLGDLLGDEPPLDELCRGVDTLIHLAGPNEVRAAAAPAEAVNEVVTGTLRLAEAAVRAGVGRVVYVSTIHVYGARLQAGARVDEETPCEPRAAYGLARLCAEHLLAAYGPPDLVVLRLTNSVGAPAAPDVDRWSLVANDLCRQGATTGELRLRSDGTQWRDFVPLADVCRIIADAARSGALDPGTYNLGAGHPLTVRQLAGLIQDAFERAGQPRPPLRAPEPVHAPPGPPLISVARLGAAGFRAEGSIGDAVAETVEFCLAHRQELTRAALS